MTTSTMINQGIKTEHITYDDKSWTETKRDKEGRMIGFANSQGYWEKWIYGKDGEQISYRNSDGKLVIR